MTRRREGVNFWRSCSEFSLVQRRLTGQPSIEFAYLEIAAESPAVHLISITRSQAKARCRQGAKCSFGLQEIEGLGFPQQVPFSRQSYSRDLAKYQTPFGLDSRTPSGVGVQAAWEAARQKADPLIPAERHHAASLSAPERPGSSLVNISPNVHHVCYAVTMSNVR